MLLEDLPKDKAPNGKGMFGELEADVPGSFSERNEQRVSA